MSAVLDTHTVLWYLEKSQELSALARTTIEEAIREARDVHVSAISLVETVYLVERRRLPLTALQRLPLSKTFHETLFPTCPTASSPRRPTTWACHWSLVTAASKPPESKQSGSNSREAGFDSADRHAPRLSA